MASATVARLNIHLGANSTAVAAGLLPAQSSLAAIGNQINALRYSMAGLAGGAVLGWGVKLAAEMETASVAFEVMIGDAGKAKQLFGELKDFAVATPFEFGELRDASRTLLAMGIGVNDVMRTISMLGDVSAGTNQPLNEMASLFGQVAVAGRLTGNELRQFNERGIPLMEALAQQMGVTKGQIREMVEAGKISFADVERAIGSMVQNGGRFFKLMEKQSQTLAGRFSTLSDKAKIALGNLGAAISPALSKLVEAATPLVDMLSKMSLETAQNVVKITAWVGGITAAVVVIPKVIAGIVAFIQAIRAWSAAQIVALSLSGPAGWAVLAGAAVAAAAGMVALNYAFEGIDESAKKAAESAKQVAEESKKAGVGINNRFKVSEGPQLSQEATDAAVKNGEVTRSVLETGKAYRIVIKESAEAAKINEQMADGARRLADQMQALQQRGDELTKSLRSPMEQFVDTAREVGRLAEAGAISGETYARAMAAAKQEFLESEKSARRIHELQAQPGTAAAERFTGAGLSAVNSGRREMDHLAKLAEEDARIQKEQKALLAEANRLLGTRPPIKTVSL